MLISGSVTLNGSQAPDGLTVFAKVGAEVRGSSLVSNGHYDLVVNGTNGETVNFYLNNLPSSQTVQFDNVSNGGVLLLDLSFAGTVSASTMSTSQTLVGTTVTTTSTEIPEYGGAALPLALLAALMMAVIAMRRLKRRG